MVKLKLSPNIGFMMDFGLLIVMLGFMELKLPAPKQRRVLMVFCLSDLGLVMGTNKKSWGFSLLDILFGVRDLHVISTGSVESCVSPKGNHYKVESCRGWRCRKISFYYFRLFRYRGQSYNKVTSYVAMADRIMDRYCPGDSTKEHIALVVDSLAIPMTRKSLNDLLTSATNLR